MPTAHEITETEYRAALAEMVHLAEAEPDRRSPEGRRLAALAVPADAYEVGQPGAVPADLALR